MQGPVDGGDGSGRTTSTQEDAGVPTDAGLHKVPAAELVLEAHRRKPDILIIYTGGTLGMRKDDSGSLRPVRGYLNSQLVRSRPLPQFN
jgi:L-asparaginase/Glu-tRNA(Gln) amidotransferase subunit D